MASIRQVKKQINENTEIFLAELHILSIYATEEDHDQLLQISEHIANMHNTTLERISRKKLKEAANVKQYIKQVAEDYNTSIDELDALMNPLNDKIVARERAAHSKAE